MKRTLFAFAVLLSISGQAVSQHSDFVLSGYIDLEFEKQSDGDNSTFDIHHFNLLPVFTYDQFRVFSEIEFEHGTALEAADGQGELALERAWAEYVHSNRLVVRAGKFLTPFGIYNLIHDATPTFVTTSLPLLYQKHQPFGVGKDRLYAKFYTGLQVFGRFQNQTGFKAEYTVGIGNGRSSESFSTDNDGNKALLGRIYLQMQDRLMLGFSHYRDRNESGLSGKSAAREHAYDADLEYRMAGLQVQTEFALFRLENQMQDFQTAVSYYIQAVYSLGIVTPILRFDVFDPNKDMEADLYRTLLVGINLAVTPLVYLKSEIQFNSHQAADVPNHHVFLSSISVAF